MNEYNKDSYTNISDVTLRVRSLENSKDFYKNVIGLQIMDEDTDYVVLGSQGTKRITLVKANNKKDFNEGIYHIAFILPTEVDLASWLKHQITLKTPLYGATNHEVSHAIYLSDPEGNGIEVYTDTPSNQWDVKDGVVNMVSLPLNIESLLEKVDDNWDINKLEVRIGHLHFRVKNIYKNADFYKQLGFDVTFDLGSAVFMSFNGYHHHVAFNNWSMNLADLHKDDDVDIESFTISYSNKEALNNVLKQMESYKEEGNMYLITDPSNIKINLLHKEN